MIIFKNATETKAVNITIAPTGTVIAAYTQRHEDSFTGRIDEQVLQFKYFKSIDNAARWAKKMLS